MNKRIATFILAISLISPSVVMAEDNMFDVAANQYAAASSELSDECAAEKANDGINDNADYTAWRSASNDVRPYWQTDMAIGYKISKIEIDARKGSTAEERSNFRIIASNNPEFNEYKILGECKDDFGENKTLSVVCENKDRYQYVRVEKTSDGELSIGEIRIYVKKASLLYGTEELERNQQYPLTDAETRHILPEDIIGTSIEEEVLFLSSLNIMRGYPDGSFLPDEYITRAEFATIASRLQNTFNYTAKASEATFYDVPQEHWAYDAIEYCYRNGIIHGVDEGYFAPEELITYEQVVKILVSVLGYESYAQSNGAYPQGYMRTAQMLGILDGVTDEGGSITRGNIAKMCYLALFARLIDTFEGVEDTLLTRYFKLARTKGCITEVNGLSLTDKEVVTEEENYIVVNNIKMFTDNPMYRNWFGYIADVYYRERDDGEYETAVVILSKKGESIDIDAENVIEFSNSGLLRYYDSNDKIRKLNFKNDLDVIYNNKAMLSYDYTTIIPNYGTIKAIDNDGDGKYDIMMIRAVKTHIVNWVDAVSKTIYLKPESNASVAPLKYEDSEYIVNIYDIEGGILDFADLKEWNVLSVESSATSASEIIVNIYVSDAFTRGTLSTIGEDYVIIRNKEYKIAETLNLSELKVGNEGIFYIDYYGKIAAFDGDNDNYGKYGFLTRVGYDDMENEVYFNIFTSSGKVKKYVAAERMTIDGERCTDVSDVNELKSSLLRGGGTGGEVQQLVRFTTNSKGEMKKIDTVYKHPQYEDAGESLSKDFSAASRYYKGDAGTFEMMLRVDSNAFVVRIPENLKDEHKYELAGNSWGWDAYSTFEAYDCGEMNIAKAAVIPSNVTVSIDTAAFCVVDKVQKGLNEDDEVVDYLYGLYKGEYIKYMEYEPGVLSNANLKRGDIIAMSLSSDNKIKRIEQRFYNGNKPSNAPTNSISVNNPMGPSNNTPHWNLFMAYGTIVAREGNLIKVKADTSSGQTLSAPDYETVLIQLDKSNLKKYIYDSENDEVRLATNEDFVDLKSSPSSSLKVVYRAGSLNVYDIVILK